jgi:cell division protein FtsW (lipid II flippase)
VTLRNRELGALVFVGILTAIGFASVYIARQSQVSSASLTYAAFFFVLYLAAHFVARLTVPYADPYLLPIAGLLTAIGLTEIYRLNPKDAFRQGIWIVIGVALFAATLYTLRRDFRVLERYKYLFGLGAIALLFLPRVPLIGKEVNGAQLWVNLGPFSFQPGELGKIALIVFLAGYLHEKREVLAQGRLKDFGPLLVIWGGCMLVLISTKDFGGGLLYFGIFLSMLYVATARVAYVGAGLALFGVGAFGIYHLVPHVRERFDVWLHAFHYASTSGYQITQGLYAISYGGFGGTWFGNGLFTDASGHQLVPYLNTDFIYAALAQELGLVGIAAMLMIYMVFVLRGFKNAMLVDDGFAKLVAAGLTFAFALQTFIIVGGILRLIPLTGITLPFVAYGGSSILANFILLAGLLLVSNRANAPA